MEDLGSKKALELVENVSVQVFNLWCTLTQNTGSIFWAVDLIERNHTVLVKTSSFLRYQSLSQRERAVLDQLCGTQGIPDIVWSRTESEQDIILLSSRIRVKHWRTYSSQPGKNYPWAPFPFWQRNWCICMLKLGQTYSEKTVQITCLQDIYSRSYMYANLTPKNVLVLPVSSGHQFNNILFFWLQPRTAIQRPTDLRSRFILFKQTSLSNFCFCGLLFDQLSLRKSTQP